MKRLIFSLFYLISYHTAAEKVKTNINVIEYHDQPPFIINKTEQKGFSFDIVKALNDRSENFNYQLSIIYSP